MDEPTSALDPASTMKIEELMTQLKQEYTVVIVTHNMQQAARISDKCAFFLVGELVEMDDTQRIFCTSADKRTEDYISGPFWLIRRIEHHADTYRISFPAFAAGSHGQRCAIWFRLPSPALAGPLEQ